MKKEKTINEVYGCTEEQRKEMLKEALNELKIQSKFSHVLDKLFPKLDNKTKLKIHMYAVSVAELSMQQIQNEVVKEVLK